MKQATLEFINKATDIQIKQKSKFWWNLVNQKMFRQISREVKESKYYKYVDWSLQVTYTWSDRKGRGISNVNSLYLFCASYFVSVEHLLVICSGL